MADLVRQFDGVFVRENRSQIELLNERIDSSVVPNMTLSHPDFRRLRETVMVTDSSSHAGAALRKLYTERDCTEN
jgi:hypothetical protein